MPRLFSALLLGFLGCAGSIWAQPTDSVVVSGRIRNLTPALYRSAPQVIITRSNVLQASQELARPAPIQPDGRFRVSMPLTYPLEEMTFNFGQVATAFLAAPGSLTIDLDADSLFVAAIPFRFGGINAQVNGQYAAYRAYQARTRPMLSGDKLVEQLAGRYDLRAHQYLTDEFARPFREFSRQQPPFPLLSRWVLGNARYDALSFQLDKALAQGGSVANFVKDTLRVDGSTLLTAARATAYSRFGAYALQRYGQAQQRVTGSGLDVATIASLLEQYGKRLTADDRQRLQTYREKGSVRGQELRYLNQLIERNTDTLQRLMSYELMIRELKKDYDSLTIDYLKGYVLASALPTLTAAYAGLLYQHIRPRIGDVRIGQSLDELYGLAVKDSARTQAANRLLSATIGRALGLEVAPGIFVTLDRNSSASALLNALLRRNAGKVLYMVQWTPDEDWGRRLAADVQRLRDTFSAREFALVYVNADIIDRTAWLEYLVRNQLQGEHIYLYGSQLTESLSQIPALAQGPVYLIDRSGKFQRRSPALPDDWPKLIEQIRKLL